MSAPNHCYRTFLLSVKDPIHDTQKGLSLTSNSSTQQTPIIQRDSDISWVCPEQLRSRTAPSGTCQMHMSGGRRSAFRTPSTHINRRYLWVNIGLWHLKLLRSAFPNDGSNKEVSLSLCQWEDDEADDKNQV